MTILAIQSVGDLSHGSVGAEVVGSIADQFTAVVHEFLLIIIKECEPGRIRAGPKAILIMDGHLLWRWFKEILRHQYHTEHHYQQSPSHADGPAHIGHMHGKRMMHLQRLHHGPAAGMNR